MTKYKCTLYTQFGQHLNKFRANDYFPQLNCKLFQTPIRIVNPRKNLTIKLQIDRIQSLI